MKMKEKTTNKLQLAKLSPLVIIFSMLMACGGGGGSDSSSSVKNDSETKNIPEPNPKPIPQPIVELKEIEGSARTIGNVLNNLNIVIEAKCANGTGFKSTVVGDLFGAWSGKVEKKQLPCKLKAISDSDHYFAYVTGKEKFVNINPISNLIIAYASQQNPEDWFNSAQGLTETDLAVASEKVKNELILKQYDINQDVDLLTKNIMESTSYYDTLDQFQESVNHAVSFKDYNALVNLLKNGQVETIPFAPEDYARLAIDYSKCSGVAYQGNTKLLTYCSSELLPDFMTSKLRQKDKGLCEIKKMGDRISINSGKTIYEVKINQQTDDKITDNYPVMNTLLLSEANTRIEFVFQYDLLILAGAYKIDSNGNQIELIQCDSV